MAVFNKFNFFQRKKGSENCPFFITYFYTAPNNLLKGISAIPQKTAIRLSLV